MTHRVGEKKFKRRSAMRGGLGQKCQWAMSHVFGLCRMSLGYVSCHRARMFSGNVFCVDRAYVFGQCFLCT